MALRKDIWRVGLVRAPLADVVAAGAVVSEIAWLPEEGRLRFLADPFGLWRDGRLYLFAEAYDYRDRHGWIEVLTLDADLRLLERRPALREPWHLSYPFVFEADGETWMLPEAHKSGKLTLYRAVTFPDAWAPAATIALDAVAIDATPLFHDGLWWLFYAPATSKADKVSALHVAFAERLTGPWTSHPGNPVRYDPASSRPGGAPLVENGVVILPVQDCSATYGGAIRPLRITRLTTDGFEAEAGDAIRLGAVGAYSAGVHTLSGAGEVTLLDAKRFDLSVGGALLDARRAAGKLLRRRA